MIHMSDLIDDTTYVIDAILESKRIYVASIICHVIIKAHESKHPMGSIPFPTLVTRIMTAAQVPFKVVAKGGRSISAIRHGILQRTGLMTKDGGSSSVAPL